MRPPRFRAKNFAGRLEIAPRPRAIKDDGVTTVVDGKRPDDWDVAGIRDRRNPAAAGGARVPRCLARRLRHAEAAFTVIDPDLLRFLPARILIDERGFAKTLIERVDALDQKGPPLTSTADYTKDKRGPSRSTSRE
jgi:hypothetical protein